MINLFQEFQEFRKILCICPNCNRIVRVSDLHLKTKAPVTRTWLDEYNQKNMLMSKKEESFDEREKKIREKSREQGRKMADKVISKTIHPVFKELKADSADVIPICHPVDYLLFKGMTNKNEVSDIFLLSKKSSIPELKNLRKQISKAISKKSYSWNSCRIGNDGVIKFE